ncbi:hypothetical protein SUGI_1135870 [Cryptomeria japonica]|nr:hypothetical protein SUGI_1135870 [Cryptomeria japonica]
MTLIRASVYYPLITFVTKLFVPFKTRYCNINNSPSCDFNGRIQGLQHTRQLEPISKPPISICHACVLSSGDFHYKSVCTIQKSLLQHKQLTQIHITRQQHTHDCTPCRLQTNIFRWMSQVLHISYNRFPRLMLNTLSDTKINWIALHSIPLSCQALKLSRRCNLKQVDRIAFMLLLIKKSIRHQPLHILQLSTAFKLFDSFKPAILHLTALSSQILTCSR